MHTMIRVRDLDESVAFYSKALGMREFRRINVPEAEYTLVFMGYGDKEEEGATLELTFNWGQTESYDVGTGFGHIALGVEDVAATCRHVRDVGGKVTRDAGAVKFGSTVIAFIEDPNGYKVELIQMRDALEEIEAYRAK
jgi:lactoylglutathione lyase